MTNKEKKEHRVTRLRDLLSRNSGGPLNLDIVVGLVAEYEPDMYDDIAEKAIREAIRKDLRADDAEGVPWALSIDDHGTYRQTSFMDEDEFRFAIRQYMKRARANEDRAYKLAERCKAIHGVWIDPAVEAASA